jgi:hypothetical protein
MYECALECERTKKENKNNAKTKKSMMASTDITDIKLKKESICTVGQHAPN